MSYTQLKATELKTAQETILQITRISRDEYAALCFEHGCLFANEFVKKYCQNTTDAYELLTRDDTLGFWDWWVTKYRFDDKLILDTNHPAFGGDRGGLYPDLKACMIGDDTLEKQLFHLINNHLCPTV